MVPTETECDGKRLRYHCLQRLTTCIPTCIPDHIIQLQALIYMVPFGLPRGTILKKDLEIQGLFFRLSKSGQPAKSLTTAPST